nr:MAG TPA: hypothetical protein [Caudoviricetes sp.]
MYHDLSPLSSMIFNLILRTTARSETKFVLVSVYTPLISYAISLTCPKTVSLRHFEFPHASVHAFCVYRTYHCTSDSTTTTISSDADSMKFVTVFSASKSLCLTSQDLNL